MSFIKTSVALAVASFILTAPAFAQGAGADTTTPTGRSDSDSGAAMKSGSMKSDKMKDGGMTKPATANGTTNPPGQMSDPASK